LNHLYDQLVAAVPADRPFLEVPGGLTWSYGDLVERNGCLAAALVASGVAPGDRVVVQVEKTPEALALYLACIRAGAVYLPLNTGYILAELDYFIGDAQPSLLVCDPARRDGIVELAARHGVRAVETLDAAGQGTLSAFAERQAPGFATVPRSADDLAAILYTSGTTGRSKGAMLRHGNLASNARALVEAWRFTSADRLIHALPIYHTHGLFVATNTTLLAGASMLFLARFDAGAIIDLLPAATALMGVPTFYTRLLAHPGLTAAATRNIRLFVSGSAPLLADTHAQWRERTGHDILERYGMTETSMNTSNPYDGERRAGTVGFPLPGVELRVVDPQNGRALPQGEVGMIQVRGPNVFEGYWRQPEKTAAEFTADGFFTTGDLGRIDAQGYVAIVGRGKDLIISGGFNVYPKEVESELDALPGVAESAVIGVPHPDFGEGVTAVVVPRRPGGVDPASLAAALSGRLARYKLPKQLILVDELPRNSMGKVQKNLLRERFRDLYAAPEEGTPGKVRRGS
jgi:malonyl-CoA/methylmalonyl-CoA synthetase